MATTRCATAKPANTPHSPSLPHLLAMPPPAPSLRAPMPEMLTPASRASVWACCRLPAAGGRGVAQGSGQGRGPGAGHHVVHTRLPQGLWQGGGCCRDHDQGAGRGRGGGEAGSPSSACAGLTSHTHVQAHSCAPHGVRLPRCVPCLQHKFHRVPVVDDDNTCVGIVTRSDIFWALVSRRRWRRRPGAGALLRRS